MLNRLTFVMIALFWVTMNVLLWRSEYGEHPMYGSAVPPKIVWQKMLTAPDESPLNILQRGKRIGTCRWSTAVSEGFAAMSEAPTPGAAEKLRKYRLEVEGGALLAEAGGRVRFECDLLLSNQSDWEEFDLHLHRKPLAIEIHSKASEQNVRVSATDGEDTFDRVFTYSELQDPETLITTLAGPMASGVLDGFYLPASLPQSQRKVPAVKFEAHHDVLTIAHQPVRVYRINLRIMDRLDVVVFVNNAGEIFRVNLPGDIVLLHDKLSNL